MVFGNPAVIVQNMFGKTPKSFNAVDMVLSAIGKGLAVIQAVVFAQPLQRVVASEGVDVVDRALSRFLPNDSHEFLLGHMLHDPCVDLAIPLQKPKNNVFTGCSTSALAFASAAKIALVHLDLAAQFATLKLGHMVDRFSEFLIDARNRLVVQAKIMREAVGRLLLIEPLYDGDLRSDSLQRLLFSTALVPAPDISSTRLRDLERTAENTLSAP